MTLAELIQNCNTILPEIVIGVTLCVVILADMAVRFDRSRTACGVVALTGILLALWIVIARIMAGGSSASPFTFMNMIHRDVINNVFSGIFLAATAAVILFSMRSRETEDYRQGEYFCLLLGGLLGAMFLAASNNYLLFFLGIETLSICSYVLAGSLKHERFSAEASLKYLIYGAMASGVMLFGLSYLYGITGTLEIEAASNAIIAMAGTKQLSALSVALVLLFILTGVGFKIAMVPFHFWCPDVYQGSPTPITAYLSVVSKAAGFSALLKIMLPFFALAGNANLQPGYSLTVIVLPGLFGLLSVLTMTWGNLVASRQTDVKRLLAYSSIAHAGYLLMAMTVYTNDALEAMFFYFIIYMFMNLGAFWVVIVLVNRLGGADIERFRGAAFKAPFLFVTMFIFLISLTGLPPTAGFVGKFMIFKVVVGAGLTRMDAGGGLTPMAVFYFSLALVGVLNSVVSLYYYMKIARSMALRTPTDDVPLGDDTLDRVYAAAFAVPTLALLYFTPVLEWIRLASQ